MEPAEKWFLVPQLLMEIETFLPLNFPFEILCSAKGFPQEGLDGGCLDP